jgi:hypothetical protein
VIFLTALWLIVTFVFATEFYLSTRGTPMKISWATNHIFMTANSGGEFGLVINGSDVGTVLLKTCVAAARMEVHCSTAQCSPIQ